jgi:recombination protein RecA
MATSKIKKHKKEPKENTKRSSKNINTIENIAKQVEDEAKQPIKIEKRDDLFFAKTGSTLMDIAGGFAFGKIINIVGDNSTGKTLLVMECIAQTREWFKKNIKKGKLKWVYDDAEAGFSFDPKKMYGIEILSEKDQASDTVEDFEYNLNSALDSLKENEYLIYVLDSLDGLTSTEEKGRQEERHKYIKAKREGKKVKELSGSYQTEKPKKMSELFRTQKNKIKNKNCLLIIVSQVRDKIGVTFGDKQTRTGGRALDFYASVVWWLAVLEKVRIKETDVAVVIKARNKKNKVAKPYRKVNMHILFDYGIDDITSNIEYLYDLRTPEGKLKDKSEKVKWDEKEYTAKTLIRHIENNNLEEDLIKRVEQKWYEFEASIAPNRKRKF